jgi:hypothetical protein
MLLLFALVLPSIYWDAGPESAAALKEAGVTRVLVPASQVESWRTVTGISVAIGDPLHAVKLTPPAVNYRMEEASASQSPWIDSNGSKILRQPHAQFYYNAPGATARLAAAEAFMFGASAMVHTDAAGLKPLAEMIRFLGTLEDASLPPAADIGFIDDGTPEAGEVMNLMVRRNLLFRIVPASDSSLALNVRLGSESYPKKDAADPSRMAQKIRADLTDEKRLIRIFGSPVVIAVAAGDPSRLRLQLLNYAAAARNAEGIHVRVRGKFRRYKLATDGQSDASLLDYSPEPEATEFTLAKIKTYAIIDLYR